jgi:hypothetical protein
MNQQEFNYETHLEGKHRLVTRGGIEVPKEAVERHNPTSGEHYFKYNHPKSGNWYITNSGKVFTYKESLNDLFMLPIEPIDETIPFDLEKFKSGEFNLVCIADKKQEVPLFTSWCNGNKMMSVVWDSCGVAQLELSQLKENFVLKRKPTSPYTHPHLYEVSDDKKVWMTLEKYYEFIDGNRYPHIARVKGSSQYCIYKHLRLKQPTEISKDQAFDALWNKLEVPMMQQVLTEKFGEFKIK